MSTDPERITRGAPATLEPVPPALVVRIAMRPMTKLLNPLIRKLAGRRHFRMAALVRHVGRRSGRSYLAPVTARRPVSQARPPQAPSPRHRRAAGRLSVRGGGRTGRAGRP